MQEKACFVNVKTGKLHYTGFCSQSKMKPFEIRYFDSEDEALAVYGRALSICKNCTKKRDKMLQAMKGEGK